MAVRDESTKRPIESSEGLCRPDSRAFAPGGATAAAFLAGLWLVARPYEGIRHDAQLYAVQIAHRLHPANFQDDLFFAFGSQDDYSLFSRVGATLAASMGIGHAMTALYWVATLAWFTVTLWWLRPLNERRWGLAGAAYVIGIHCFYSPIGPVLESPEYFVTARALAGPLAIAGLAAWLSEQRFWSVAAIGVAGLFHPLVAAPALAVVLVYGLSERIGWPRTAGLAASALTVGLGIAAMLESTHRMDDEWYRIVRNFSPICAPEEWRVEDIAQWLSGAAVLVAAAPVMPPGLARLARAIVLVGLLGVAVSAAGAELRIAALVQTQPWRAMWLVSWFAPLATLYWFRGADAQAPARRILMFGTLAVLALTPFYWTAVGAVVGLLHAGVLVVFVVWDVPTIRPPSVRFAALWTFAMFTVAVVLAGVEVIALTSVEGRNFEHLRLFRVEVASVFGWCLLPAIVVAVALFVRLVRGGARIRVAVAVVTLAVGLASADARSGARRLFDEIASKGLPELAAAIPVGASVYWPEHLHLVWFGLERASYVSSYQLAGAVFSRKTAVEGARRIRNVERIGGSDVVVRARERDATAHRSRDVTDVEHACRDPRLDFVILDTDGDHPSRPGYRDARTGRTHWLYDCTHERRSKSKS